MKNFLFLSTLMVLSLPLVVQAAFPDVPSAHPHREAINYVKAQGIVAGNPDGTFKPDQNISRAAFTKIMVETYFNETDINLCRTGNTGFSDVAPQAWFAPYVCVAFNKNLIQGYPDGTFRPGDNINIVEAAKIISVHRQGERSGSPWFKPYLDDLGAVGALPPQVNAVDQSVTRGLMAEIIHRLQARLTTKSATRFDGTGFVPKPAAVAVLAPKIPTGEFAYQGLLASVDGSNSSGQAMARFAHGQYDLVARFSNLPDPAAGFFYEGWVVKPGSVISTGEAVKHQGQWVDVYQSSRDLTDHTFYVLTLEPDDGDPAPADHVVEGALEKISAPGVKAAPVYEDFSSVRYQQLLTSGEKFVLNFSAAWCPNCQKLDRTLREDLASLPAGTIVLKTDYDEETALKAQYGVVRQTTGVFIENGKALQTKSGLSISDIRSFFE